MTPEEGPGWEKLVDETDRMDKGAPPVVKPMNEVLKVFLIIVVGIPLGLMALAALVLGVCLMGR